MTPEKAARELLRRTEATESLISFTEYTYPRYETALPHRHIAEQLERVERRETDRLMLLCPPRHGKSELASRRFPAWYLGRHPEQQFISAAANDDLATDFGRDVRNIVASPEYAALFDTRLAEDSHAKGKWHTAAEGIFYAVGVGGSVKGRGAHVLLIDDPFAKMESALSENERKRVWDWFTGTLYDRLMPGGVIVIINHRMHEEDLSGMLLQQQAAGGDKWDVVELPAIAEADDPLDRTPGEALWPEAYPLATLERIRRNIQPRFWSALYQQKPTPDEGSYFKRDWFGLYDEIPTPQWAKQQRFRIYGGSDYATKDGIGDYTVHIVVGIDQDDNMYVLDMWRDQRQSDVWVDAFCNLVIRWKPLLWGEPADQIRKSLGPFIHKRMRERRAYCRREQLMDVQDKVTKARSFQGRAAMGKVFLPRNADWLADMLHELTTFDAGKHDDIVDTLGVIGRLLDKMVPGQKLKPGGEDDDRWDKAFRRQDRLNREDKSWRTK
jgi:predicted phage terminase large subunit-like protein